MLKTITAVLKMEESRNVYRPTFEEENYYKCLFLNYRYPVKKSSHNVMQDAPIDLRTKNRKMVGSRGHSSKYRRWGVHLQEVESPLQELTKLMDNVQLSKTSVRNHTINRTQENMQEEGTETPSDEKTISQTEINFQMRSM